MCSILSGGQMNPWIRMFWFLQGSNLPSDNCNSIDILRRKRNVHRLSPAQRMLQRQPGGVLLGAGDGLGDEVHAVDTVGDVGVEALAAVDFLTAGASDHVGIGGRVDVGESLEITFGMTAGDTAGGFGRG